MTLQELLQEIDRHSVSDKWALVKHLLGSLETEQAEESSKQDWHEFVREMYGALRDAPIQRWDEGESEERESVK